MSVTLQRIPATDALVLFLDHLRGERRLAETTCDAYARDLSGFLGFLKDYLDSPITLPELQSVSVSGFRAYLAHRRRGETPVSSATLQRELSAIRTFYRYLERRWDLRNDALPLIRGPKRTVPLPKPIAASDAKRLVQTRLDSPGLGQSR